MLNNYIAAGIPPETSDTAMAVFIALGIIAIALFIFIKRRR